MSSCSLDGELNLDDCTKVTEVYELGKELGRGCMGFVRECKHKLTGEMKACKTVLKDILADYGPENPLRQEIMMMNAVSGHPSCLELEEVFEDDEGIHLIMELCEGGDVFYELERQGRLTECEAAVIFNQVVEAVSHCHDLGIVHRDIKPENILLKWRDSLPLQKSSAYIRAGQHQQPLEVKLADFGLALPLGPDGEVDGVAGSPFYVAPEVVITGRGKKEADMWSLGVVLYGLLSRSLPFMGTSGLEIAKISCEVPADLERQPWPQISNGAKDLVHRLLQADPAQRLTAEGALVHPWLAGQVAAADAERFLQAQTLRTQKASFLQSPCQLSSQLEFLHIPTSYEQRHSLSGLSSGDLYQPVPPLLPASSWQDSDDETLSTASSSQSLSSSRSSRCSAAPAHSELPPLSASHGCPLQLVTQKAPPKVPGDTTPPTANGSSSPSTPVRLFSHAQLENARSGIVANVTKPTPRKLSWRGHRVTPSMTSSGNYVSAQSKAQSDGSHVPFSSPKGPTSPASPSSGQCLLARRSSCDSWRQGLLGALGNRCMAPTSQAHFDALEDERQRLEASDCDLDASVRNRTQIHSRLQEQKRAAPWISCLSASVKDETPL